MTWQERGGEVDLRINIYRGQDDTNNAIINANNAKNGVAGVENGTDGVEVPLNKEQTQIEKLLQIIQENPSATQAYQGIFLVAIRNLTGLHQGKASASR